MPDDFQPHVNIKKMFSAGMLSTEEEMQQFSEHFPVQTHLIKTYCSSRRSQKNKAAFLREQGGTQNKSIN